MAAVLSSSTLTYSLPLHSHKCCISPIKPVPPRSLPPSHSIRVSCRLKNSIRCQALGDNNSLNSTVYQGVYGPWSVEQSDVREVILYRSGLVTAAASFVTAASTVFLPPNSFLREFLDQQLNLLYALGAGGLGLSLFLIHIYVTEIKRTLQALWAVGVLGSLAAYINLAQPVGQSLPDYVVDNPVAVWFVGPLFAALTGLVFKEGLCYGKLEAGVLTFVIPIVLLGHLSGLMDDGVKLSLLGVWMVLFVVFSARKFTQPIKYDILLIVMSNYIEKAKKLKYKDLNTRADDSNPIEHKILHPQPLYYWIELDPTPDAGDHVLEDLLKVVVLVLKYSQISFEP